MRNFFFGFASFVFVLAGCSSSGSSGPDFGPDPDYASVANRFEHPDGTMNGSVLARYDASRSGASGVPDASGTTHTSSVHTNAMHILSGSATELSSCPALQARQAIGSCACPAGGSLSYDMAEAQASPHDFSARFRFDTCSFEGSTIDGHEFLHWNDGAGKQRVYVVVDAAVTVSAVTHQVDLVALYENGTYAIAMQVDDGWVVVETNATGGYTVRDKNGTWTCATASGATTCTSSTGETKTF